jgi:hypothetical protein
LLLLLFIPTPEKNYQQTVYVIVTDELNNRSIRGIYKTEATAKWHLKQFAGKWEKVDDITYRQLQYQLRGQDIYHYKRILSYKVED